MLCGLDFKSRGRARHPTNGGWLWRPRPWWNPEEIEAPSQPYGARSFEQLRARFQRRIWKRDHVHLRQQSYPCPFLNAQERTTLKSKMYHLKFSFFLFSLVFGTLARGENANIPSHSCPTAVEYTGTVLGTNETFHRFDLLVLQQKMRTKSELDKMTDKDLDAVVPPNPHH